jgi:hypothetical protein
MSDKTLKELALQAVINAIGHASYCSYTHHMPAMMVLMQSAQSTQLSKSESFILAGESTRHQSASPCEAGGCVVIMILCRMCIRHTGSWRCARQIFCCQGIDAPIDRL